MTLDKLIAKLQELKVRGLKGSAQVYFDDDTQYWTVTRRGTVDVESGESEAGRPIAIINIGELA